MKLSGKGKKKKKVKTVQLGRLLKSIIFDAEQATAPNNWVLNKRLAFISVPSWTIVENSTKGGGSNLSFYNKKYAKNTGGFLNIAYYDTLSFFLFWVEGPLSALIMVLKAP